MAALRNRASRAFCTGARLGRKALLPDGWEAVVGIECHAQLNVPHKLFSRTSPTDPATAPSSSALPNTHVAPFDAGYPGTLPRLQNSAVAAALRAALALQCTIVPRSYFDRKHYFYADQPMGYQITQKRSTSHQLTQFHTHTRARYRSGSRTDTSATKTMPCRCRSSRSSSSRTRPSLRTI